MTNHGDTAADRVHASFAKQVAMQTLGAEIASIADGTVTLQMPFATNFTQQHGFLHAGAMTSLLDSACGYAALTRMPPDAGVLTIEFAVKLLAPARGRLFRAEGRVIKGGRRLIFCEGNAFADEGADRVQIASISTTMMVVEGRPGIEG
ncbi:MAG: PaaI family thioesterase [Pseudomonadota bacterium]